MDPSACADGMLCNILLVEVCRGWSWRDWVGVYGGVVLRGGILSAFGMIVSDMLWDG